MGNKDELKLREKIENYEKVIRLVENSEEEINYQDKIVQDILGDLLGRYQPDSQFGKEIFKLQELVWEAKRYKDMRLMEVSQELKDGLKKLKKEEENYKEDNLWD